MRPIIGIIGKTDENKKSEVGIDYVNAIEKSGGIPLLLPYSENADTIASYVGICDGFMFVGGVDISPKYFGEEVLNDTVCICKERDDFDFLVLSQVLKTNKPILAICRGIQLVNVALGGTLIQDVPTQINSIVSHKQNEGRYEFSHSVKVIKDAPLFELVQNARLKVNSFHHQAIKTLGKGVRVMAQSDDGVIEAIYSSGERFLRAYQWHPELLFNQDENSRKLFGEFVGVCLKNS
ncbi:MAG: gamma-glutamyl-gamma-aminobutyrate hydrolase family protein [Clostridia bacterium]|nr:gamma-glutamyl-gamma-aminobutyrate hydrolase family protein [Clostridia bacterium]